ncbi:MAG: flagellar biosynthetic protein FliR [Gammaproteobacteria bacterium]|jgi:flagellar biosynthetic protein FliR|nr:flagellar biosynthetic protein FliR [Gammaproteobacteria bacterium]
MDFLVSEIVAYLYSFVLPFARISAFILSAPIFSLQAFNVRFRVLFSAVLTFVVVDSLGFDAQALSLTELMSLVVMQVFIGVFAGFLLQIVNGAVAVGGQAISNSMGLGMASLVDPSLGNVPVISQFLIILSTFIFMAIDGHLILIQLLLYSFDSIAVNEAFTFELVYRVFIEWSPLLFLGGLVIALPILISVLLINAGLGMITRSAPSLNIISVGFPAILITGTLLLMFAIPGIIQRIGDFWQEGFSLLGTLWGG